MGARVVHAVMDGRAIVKRQRRKAKAANGARGGDAGALPGCLLRRDILTDGRLVRAMAQAS